ncbi:MAG: S53 family peptidase [Candidatus Dormibacteria bacterium]
MTSPASPVAIPDSQHTHLRTATRIGATDKNTLLTLTIALRENPDGASVFEAVDRIHRNEPGKRQFLSQSVQSRHHGARSADVTKVTSYAKDHHLAVTEVDAPTRTVKVTGRVADIEEAFGVTLSDYSAPNNVHYHSYNSDIHIPAELSGIITHVMGLSSRPVCRPHYVRPTQQQLAQQIIYPPHVIAKAMKVPPVGAAGTPGHVPSQKVVLGIIELGGLVTDADITAYCAKFGYPKPNIVHVSVDGQQPQNDPGGANVEVALDVEVGLGMAPGLNIVVYDAPNTSQGVRDAIVAAMKDTVHRPMSISMSWGGAELLDWSRADMLEINHALAQASALGCTFGFSAGDGGSTDGINDGKQHADFPATSPYAIAAGGVRAVLNRVTGAIQSIAAWGGTAQQMQTNGGTGGGVSEVFPVPSYQSDHGIHPVSANPPHKPGRGEPDASGVADPQTGLAVISDGTYEGVGGTSASAPEIMTGIAVLSALQNGKGFGLINKDLYALGQKGFTDVTSGTNGAYSAGPGWDLTTGWGFPDFQTIAKAVGINITAALRRLAHRLPVPPSALDGPTSSL